VVQKFGQGEGAAISAARMHENGGIICASRGILLCCTSAENCCCKQTQKNCIKTGRYQQQTLVMMITRAKAVDVVSLLNNALVAHLNNAVVAHLERTNGGFGLF
jgi:hypothetical protein